MSWKSILTFWDKHVHSEFQKIRSGELLRRYLAERQESYFREILSRYSSVVYLQCKSILRSDDLSAEAFQETFIALIQKGHTIRDHERIGAWLARTAQRKSFNIRRRQMKTENVVKRIATQVYFDEQAKLDQLERKAAVEVALLHLPEKYRKVLIHCFFDGMTHEAVARKLNIPLGTVDTWSQRGLKLVRKQLAQRGITVSTLLIQSIIASNIDAVPPGLIHSTLALVGSSTIKSHFVHTLVWSYFISFWPMYLLIVGVGVLTGSLFFIGLKKQVTPEPVHGNAAMNLAARRAIIRNENLEILQGEVIPKLSAALQTIPVWNQLKVIEVKSDEMHISVLIELKSVSGDPPKNWMTSRTEWIYNTVTQKVHALFDPKADGKWEAIREDYLTIYTKLSPKPIRMRLSALSKSYEAFQPLKEEPWDLLPHEFSNDEKYKLVVPYLGSWFPDDPNSQAETRFLVNMQGKVLCIEPDGRIQDTNPSYQDGKVTLSLWSIPLVLEDNGSKLRTGDKSWWAIRRKPKAESSIKE
ncbi:MAG: RNA polymerase sigma factor [Planctomycetia bacterium]|nr:RNA polymerase sigma factor [Planctomycetia bacterium]